MHQIFNYIKHYPYKNVLQTFFKHNYILIILFIFLGGFFYTFPDIDIYVSSLFFNTVDGFIFDDSLYTKIVFYSVNYMAVFITIALATALVVIIAFRKRISTKIKKAVLFIMLSLAMAPGVVVNEILKDNIGRARPENIFEFGGDKTFTSAFQPSRECKDNCSFVSGHASFGFFLMAFGLLAKGRKRAVLLTSGFIIGILIGIGRVIEGRHFFTDVLFAFFFVYLTIALIYEAVYYDKKDSTT